MSRFARLPVRHEIELLATVDGPIGENGKSEHGFGTIIELGPRSLVLEANRSFSIRDQITVKVIFPGQGRGDDPFAYFQGVVSKLHDQPNLHFDVTLADMTDASRERLKVFLEGANVPGPGER
jgi:hypothetical protein